MDKCAYCHREMHELYPVSVGEDKEPLTCCCDDCSQKAIAFYRYFDRTKVLFYVGIGISLVAQLVAPFFLLGSMKTLGAVGTGASFSLLGLIIVLFPFATPQTFAMLGIRGTLRLTRLIGIVMVLLGPLLAYWMRV